jgi:hypothetical protein
MTDLDPNQDTPCEVLHVVLLGFVKYFWRDAVLRLNAEERQLLIQRINSTDVRALGLAALRGETLVKYAGSLTGRDFRAIIQIAPAVLYGLEGIHSRAYEAWLALARLVPLIYQSEIDDLNIYLVSNSQYCPTIRKSSCVCIRNTFAMLSTIFWRPRRSGTRSGSTKASSMSCFIFPTTCGVSVQRFSLQQRDLNRITPSFASAASTRRTRPQVPT